MSEDNEDKLLKVNIGVNFSPDVMASENNSSINMLTRAAIGMSQALSLSAAASHPRSSAQDSANGGCTKFSVQYSNDVSLFSNDVSLFI